MAIARINPPWPDSGCVCLMAPGRSLLCSEHFAPGATEIAIGFELRLTRAQGRRVGRPLAVQLHGACSARRQLRRPQRALALVDCSSGSSFEKRINLGARSEKTT